MMELRVFLSAFKGLTGRQRWVIRQRFVCSVLAVMGAVSATVNSPVVEAGALYGINHTHWAINRFSVDGNPAYDVVGPYQRGGGGWGFSAPARWVPGMTVRVDWETGSGSSAGFPGFGDLSKYFEWLDKIDSQKRQLSKVIPVPDYTDQKVCGMTVHFLPCDELRVTTSCFAYGSPEYPIKTALQLPEPTSCPQ